MADLVRAALLCPVLSCSACHKSRLLLNSNKLCQTLIEGGVKGPQGGGDTVVNTLFACVSRNFTMGKYFGPKVFTFRNGNKRKWHFYWPSKQFEQLPKCRTDCVQAGSSCVLGRRRGRVVSSADGKIENYEQKGKTFVWVWEGRGQYELGSIFCCNGTKIDLLSISVGHTTLVYPSSSPCQAPPLRDSFSILFMALQVQVNMCDKRPHDAQCEAELLFWPSC